MSQEISRKLFEEAQKHIPGGVNSPVRAFNSVKGTPPFIVRAKGAYVYDADNKAYLDYVGTWGPAILGHAHPDIINTLQQTAKNGLSFGAPTPKEIELAKLVKTAFPSLELVRFVNSGTEATMSAIRVARGFTGKDKIIKFDGCYHGHADYLLVKAGSGATTCGIPDSLGVPFSFTEHTLLATFNDIDSVKDIIASHKDNIACVILEPVMGNMGCILPQNSFLRQLRKLCDKHNIVLIFDEVMTGFRVAFGGAQAVYDVKPDLTCLGKIIGGGLPVGAYGGRKDIMQCVAPLGPVYQAGTLSGNPLAMAVGLKTLQLLQDKTIYDDLELKGKILEKGFLQAAKKAKQDLCFQREGSLFSFFFASHKIQNAEEARQADRKKFISVFHYFLEHGIYFAPSPFEAGFISQAHSQDDIERTISVFEKAMQKLS